MRLTFQQKLNALAYRFYQGSPWEPKAGDYYTTSRADLELYQVVSVDDKFVRTRYTEGSSTHSKWPREEFLTGGFGPKRVYVPDFILDQIEPAGEAEPVITEAARVAFYEATEVTSVGSIRNLDGGLKAAFAVLSTPPDASAIREALLAEIDRLRPEYQSNSMLDHGRRQMLDHFAALAGAKP